MTMRPRLVPPVEVLASRGGTRHKHLADVLEFREHNEPGPGFTPDDEPHGIPLPWEQAWKPIPIWIVNVGLFAIGCAAVAIVLVAVMRQVWP